MKKFFFLGLMTISTISMMAAVNVADFENAAGGINVAKADTCWQGANSPVLGWNNWKSGDFNFQTYYGGNSGYGDYYAAFTVTNESANEATTLGYDRPYRSASGGGNNGSANFAVSYVDSYNPDTVSFAAQTVAGFFVNNTPYTIGGITTNSYAPAHQFKQTDYLVLKCTGLKNKVAVGTVEVYLAKEGKLIDKWTYVELASLGEIDAMTFTMDGTDKSGSWLNTPTYFAMDDFGASKPDGYVAPEMRSFTVATDVENAEVEMSARKFFRNGQIYIIRDGKVYNITGAQVE